MRPSVTYEGAPLTTGSRIPRLFAYSFNLLVRVSSSMAYYTQCRVRTVWLPVREDEEL